ncbi:hypothetical protein AB0910_06170 [Streptomyces sp. NPDC047002]|uniref:hypothetical protein n=1 Tax=Streptomyces sp. NPDC047002 TaxID=3155475 RepID=UPI003451F925
MQRNGKKLRRVLAGGAALAAVAGGVTASLSTANAATPDTHRATAHYGKPSPVRPPHTAPVSVEVFAPERGDNTGADGKGWFVDMELSFHNASLKQTGFTGPQLTGPAAHNDIPPFPGTFSPGQDDRNPGLVVLDSTVNSTAPFSGPGTNLANLFNLTGVTDRTPHGTELWDTWIVGDSIAGKDVDSVLTVAVVADLDHDGVYDDAPPVVKDANHDGRIDAKDLRLLGVASNIVQVPFHINGAPAA